MLKSRLFEPHPLQLFTYEPDTDNAGNFIVVENIGSGRSWATIATLLQTAKMNDVDPNAWLTQTLERIAQGWPISQIDALIPWNFKT